MAIRETLPLGIVLERRRIDHPWQEFSWRAVDVVPGAPARDPKGEWTVLREGESWIRYLAGTLPLSLYGKETEAYRLSLSQEPPRLFVGLRADDSDSARHDLVPFMVTASPEEAQEYLDGGDDLVEPVPMPLDVVAFVRDFVELHHVDVPFVKRKRKNKNAGPGGVRPPADPGQRNG